MERQVQLRVVLEKYRESWLLIAADGYWYHCRSFGEFVHARIGQPLRVEWELAEKPPAPVLS